ncbi:MAG: DUF3944 domain-containing protein [Rhodothermales bacterium]
MHDVLCLLERDDYAFLIGLLDSSFNATDSAKLRHLYADVETQDSADARAALNRQLEREIRYIGSSEVLYWARYLSGQQPGAPFEDIIHDVAKALKVEVPRLGTHREQLEVLVTEYATQQFAQMTPAEQQRLLEQLGVEQDKAAAFVKKSAGVFALPMLITAFNLVVVEGLIKTIIFGTIAKLIGTRLAQQILVFVAGRVPWWIQWIGPVAWSLSLGWTAIDLQGPAMRKTIPVVLYLGVCSLRARNAQAT